MKTPWLSRTARLIATCTFLAAPICHASGTPEAEQAQRWSSLGLGRVLAEASHDKWTYLALEGGGVAVVEVESPASSPKVVLRLAEGRPIAQLWIRDGMLYLIELRQELIGYTLEDPARPRLAHQLPAPSEVETPRASATPSPAPVISVSARAKVVDVTKGRAIFDGGLTEGFAPGKRVRILAQRLVEKPDLVGGGTERVPSGEVGAILRIEHAEQHRGMAPLGRGDVVSVGDVVELTDEPLSERLLVPRRAPFNLRAGFLARPFLGLDTGTATGSRSKPVGVLFDAYATYYFDDWPLALEVAIAPVGLSVSTVDRHYPTTFVGTAAYATDYFEIGLGGGALVGAAGPCGFGPPGSSSSCEENTGFTINQVLRLGALDGLHLRWQSSIFSRPDHFVFGVGRAEANLPLTSRLGLFASGGGGENGWAYGEFGVRSYFGGTGARGTVILSASLGYASIFDGPSHEEVGGPSVAFGMEWRR